MSETLMAALCECGCGEPVTEGRRYRLGHASRIRWAGHEPVPIRHGTINGYVKRGCRCDLCQTKWRDHQREYMKQRRAMRRWAKPQPPELLHGRITTYNRHKCRCAKCRAVHAAQARARRKWQPCPPPSVCPTCDRNFWTVRSATYCSHGCSAKARYNAQKQRKVYVRALDPVAERVRAKAQERHLAELEAASAAIPELSELVSEQADDERRYIVGNRWMVSLDSYVYEDVTWYEVIGLKGSDEWTLAVIHKVDRQREIDRWVEAA